MRSVIDILHIFDSKSKKLAKTMKLFWRIDGKLGELAQSPVWDINAVTYESGKSIFTRTKAIKRLLDISMEQVDNLNSKFYREYIEKEGTGVYIRIGRSCDRKSRNNLSERECKWAENYPTNLRKPSEEEFDRLLQNGYKSAMKI